MELDEDERARLLAFQTLLDSSRNASEPVVEMTALRKLCARGIPDHPKHLRPLAYSLLLEALPPRKKEWKRAARQQRSRYYGMVKVFMEELDAAPAPTESKTASDSLLTSISKDMDRLPKQLPSLRARSAPSPRSPLSPPSNHSAPDERYAGLSEVSSSSSSSSGDEAESSARIEDRHEDPTVRPSRKRREVYRILSRRAAIQRVAVVAEADHRRQYPSVYGTFSKGKERASSASPSDLETNLSPRITLSPETTLTPQLATPSNGMASSISARLGGLANSQRTPQLSLSIPVANDTVSDQSEQPSPITLLSPKPIPTPGSMPFSATSDSSFTSGSLLQPDSHVDILIRLTYVFCRAHPQWTYSSGFADIVTHLYLIYVGDIIDSRVSSSPLSVFPNRPGSKYAEEETFWAFAGLMGDIGDVVSTSQTVQAGNKDLEWALERLGRRVRWADSGLWSFLKERNMDPSSPLYAYRWIALLFTQDLSRSETIPLWDFLFAEPPSTPVQSPKLDLVIDVCAAMLLLCKGRLRKASSAHRKKKIQSPGKGLWDGLSSDEELEDLPLEDPEDAFVRGLQLLRSYPLREVGGIDAVLHTAFELRQARLIAGLSGDDPDAPGWEEARDAESRPSWTSEKLRSAASGATKKLWSGPSDGSTSISTLSSSGSKLFSKYAENVSQSDAAATLSKASTNWTASAMAKWADASKGSPSSKGKSHSTTASSDWTGIGRLWGTIKKAPNSDASYDGSDDDDQSGPRTPNKRHSTPQASTVPPKFVSPKNTVKYAPGQVPASIAARRDRSDSTTSGVSVTSLQDRLANLTNTVAPAHLSPVSQTVIPPKPLLLSGSARRASNSSGVGGRYNRSSTVSPGPSSPAANDGLSPTAAPVKSYESDGNTGGSGLYRIGSRSSIGRSPHTPTSSGRVEIRGNRRTSDGETIHAAANRLRDVTAEPSSLPRSPRRHTGLAEDTSKPSKRSGITSSNNGSESEVGTIASYSGNVHMARKWSLTDPGTGPNSPEDSDASNYPNGVRKYSLTDDQPALYRKDSSESQSASSTLPLGRTKVVKKRFVKRPTSLSLTNPNEASGMPSPVMEQVIKREVVESPVAVAPVSLPTPQIGHLTEEDYEHIYEPAEDSFILLDALEADALALREMKASLCVEIGSGSGIASAFLSTLLGPGKAAMISTDINAFACSATARTGMENDVSLNPILANLLDPLVSRLRNSIDIMIFNPPYVPTDDAELTITQSNRGIGGAWAGGDDGMSVTNILLKQVPGLLASNGRFYLVAVQQNKPDEIIANMTAMGMQCKTVLKRRAGRELLSVIRMIKPAPIVKPRIASGGRTKLLGPRSRPSSIPNHRISIPSPVLEQTGTFRSEQEALLAQNIATRSNGTGLRNGTIPPDGNVENGNVKVHKVRDSVDEMADDEDEEGYGELLEAYKS